MSDSGARTVLMQIAGLAPTLLVCLLAVILAIVNFGRVRTPAMLLLAGMLIIGLVTLIFPVVQIGLIERQSDGSLERDELERALFVLGLAASLLRALGLGLLVAAVFVGRRVSAPAVPPGAGTA